MPYPAAILMFGRDAQLLDTRRMVLEAAGFRVHAVANLADFDRAASSNSFDLMILCHSLSMEDCGRVFASTMSRQPSLRSLTLTAGTRGCPSQLLGQVMNIFDGPAKLVSTVFQLVGAEGDLASHAYNQL